MNHIRPVSIAALSLMLLGAGCNPVQNAQERAMEGLVEKVIEKNVKDDSGKNVDIDLKKGGFTVTGEDGKATFSMGEKVEIPSTFPSDVPLYADATAKAVTMSEKDNGAVVVLQSEDDADKIVAWYKEEASKKGWKQKASMELGEGSYILSYERVEDGKTAKMNITITSVEDGMTNITVGYES
ncbi:MAG: hypothetical protein WC787_00865 [Patescibacteria group bacterium]|jgi:hypothetical protein